MQSIRICIVSRWKLAALFYIELCHVKSFYYHKWQVKLYLKLSYFRFCNYFVLSPMFVLQKRQFYCNPKPQEGDKTAEVGSPVLESSVDTY